MTLKDTMIHFMTLCDGVCGGGYMVGELERNMEGLTKFKTRTIYSGSLQ